MSIHVRCACGRNLRASDKDAGRQAKCPACGAAVVIPAASAGPGHASLAAARRPAARPPAAAPLPPAEDEEPAGLSTRDKVAFAVAGGGVLAVAIVGAVMLLGGRGRKPMMPPRPAPNAARVETPAPPPTPPVEPGPTTPATPPAAPPVEPAPAAPAPGPAPAAPGPPGPPGPTTPATPPVEPEPAAPATPPVPPALAPAGPAAPGPVEPPAPPLPSPAPPPSPSPAPEAPRPAQEPVPAEPVKPPAPAAPPSQADLRRLLGIGRRLDLSEEDLRRQAAALGNPEVAVSHMETCLKALGFDPASWNQQVEASGKTKSVRLDPPRRLEGLKGLVGEAEAAEPGSLDGRAITWHRYGWLEFGAIQDDVTALRLDTRKAAAAALALQSEAEAGEVEGQVKEAVALSATDPVSACLLLQELLTPRLVEQATDLQLRMGLPVPAGGILEKDAEKLAEKVWTAILARMASIVWPRTMAVLESDLSLPAKATNEFEEFLTAMLFTRTASHLAFEEMSKGLRAPAGGSVRQHLDQAVARLQPEAIAVLDRDLKAALAAGDVRRAVLVAAVAEKVRDKGIPGAREALAKIKKEVLSGERAPKPFWKVTQVTGGVVEGYSDTLVTVVPLKGVSVVQVKARVENAGADQDPGYAPWVFNNLKRRMTEAAAKRGGAVPSAGPRCLMAQDFVFLASESGTLAPCLHIADTCPLRGELGQSRDFPSTALPAMYLAPGEALDLDVVFVVPKKPANLRLLVLGAPPVPIASAAAPVAPAPAEATPGPARPESVTPAPAPPAAPPPPS